MSKNKIEATSRRTMKMFFLKGTYAKKLNFLAVYRNAGQSKCIFVVLGCGTPLYSNEIEGVSPLDAPMYVCGSQGELSHPADLKNTEQLPSY